MSQTTTDTDPARTRRLRHLVEQEGVSRAEAEDFLAVVDAAGDEDAEFHARLVGELDARIMLAEAAAESGRARAARDELAALASVRDTRVGPSDVRRLVAGARQAST